MIVNICVWDVAFLHRLQEFWTSTHFLTFQLVHRPNLRCLFVLHHFCYRSFVISQCPHGDSSPQLSAFSFIVQSTAGPRACTHTHMSARQRPELASREFFVLSYLDRLQRCIAVLCVPCEGSLSCCSPWKKATITSWLQNATFEFQLKS